MTCFHSNFYANFHASETSIFDWIFMKFSSKCRTKKLGMIHSILGSVCSFLNSEGGLFGPKSSDQTNKPIVHITFPKLI